MKKRGLFFSFEGGEGSGKSTQFNLLCDRLEEFSIDLIRTKEPGSPHLPVCKEIRRLLLDSDVIMDFMTEVFLYNTDRVEHVNRIVRPSLKMGKTVGTDRYADSTRAYQIFARGLKKETVENLILMATGGLEPDLTFLLDIDPEIGFSRLERGLDRLEKMGMDFHRKVNAGFLNLAESYPDRFVVLDATLSIEELQEKIFCIMMERLEKAGLWNNEGVI